LLNQYPTHAKQIETLYTTSIDTQALTNYLIVNKGILLKEKRGKNYIKKPVYLSTDKIIQYSLFAVKINLQQHHFTQDAYGRVHTLISQLPSIAHPFLRIDNDVVTTIDCANSQPLLLNILFKNKYNIYRLMTEEGSLYNIIAIRHFLATVYKKQGNAKHDFKQKYMTGSLETFKEKPYINNVVKPLIYRVFFGSGPISSINKSLYNILLQLFGKQFIQALEAERKKGDLAVRLQRIESDIFIDGFKNDYVLTKHDCLLVKQGEANHFLNKLKNIYYYRHGLTPTFHN
jgi:hypothetical protein